MTKISESTLQEINPDRFLLPIIKDVRDIEAISAIFRTKTAWPLAQARIRYTCMFHMAADSERFNTIAKMEELGGYPADASRWVCSGKSLIRLFEGKMIQAFDHRAASSSFYESTIFRTGEGVETLTKNTLILRFWRRHASMWSFAKRIGNPQTVGHWQSRILRRRQIQEALFAP
jgi:hypothetical protein